MALFKKNKTENIMEKYEHTQTAEVKESPVVKEHNGLGIFSGKGLKDELKQKLNSLSS